MKKNLHISFIKKSVFTLIIIMMGYTSVYSQVKIVKCYPNPATSVINFEFKSGKDKNPQLQIYSFTGKKMTDLTVSTGKVTVLLDNEYYRGVYIFQLRDKNGKIIETGKFQIVR